MASLMNIGNMYKGDAKKSDNKVDLSGKNESIEVEQLINSDVGSSRLDDKEQLLVRRDLISTYLAWTAVVAKVDADVLEAQSTIVYDNTPVDERKFSVDILRYLASNFGLFTLALASDYLHIRDFMGMCIEQEIELDDLDAVSRKERRQSMQLKSGNPVPTESGIVDLNAAGLSYDFVQKLIISTNNSYRKYIDTKIDTEYQHAVEKLSNDAVVINGYILSNYFYILRALNYNPKFLVTFVDLLTRYQKSFM